MYNGDASDALGLLVSCLMKAVSRLRPCSNPIEHRRDCSCAKPDGPEELKPYLALWLVRMLLEQGLGTDPLARSLAQDALATLLAQRTVPVPSPGARQKRGTA